MKKFLMTFFASLLFAASVSAQGNLEKSVKKTLFIFPTDFGINSNVISFEQKQWVEERVRHTFVETFERFDFIDMPEGTSIVPFLEDADNYMMTHAQEIVQLRKEVDGRIGEAKVTLTDLQEAVKESYAFVPIFNRINNTKKDKSSDTIIWEIDVSFEIFQVSNKEKITTVNGSTASYGAILGGMRGIIDKALNIGGLPTKKKREEEDFRQSVQGCLDEVKTKICKLDEFRLKALVIENNPNSFVFDLGTDFGVGLDRRYKVWSMDDSGKLTKMLAFGKVRKTGQFRSKAQILIGSTSEGDQVIEDATFGINISPSIGVIPFQTSGFDEIKGIAYNFISGDITFTMPEDNDGYKSWIGLNMEYNTAWLTNISELYLTLDFGWVPVSGMMVYNGMLGIEKKIYFRRIGVFGIVKYGVLGANFYDSDLLTDNGLLNDTDDASILGIGGDTGIELILSPNTSLQGRIGWFGFPKQIAIIAVDATGLEAATIRAVGLTYMINLTFTL